MGRYVFDRDMMEFVPAETYYAREHNYREAMRGAHPAPRVIADTMDPVRSMLDGRYYDSKSTLRRTYREGGVIEVGNDVPTKQPPKKHDRQGVKAAVHRAFSQVGFGA